MGYSQIRRIAAAAGLAGSLVAVGAVVYLAVFLLDAHPPGIAFLSVLTTLVVLAALGLATALQPVLWAGLSRRRAAVEGVVAGGLCWAAGFPAFVFLFFYACMHRATAPAWIAAAITYGALATYLLVSPRRAWLWFAAPLAAAVVSALVLQAAPSGSCAAFN
ncbi:MAG TPA: hypothetical protein VFQ71_13965 [Gaiellales bacterium]|nr:hypothetical protein [Gaiellales bacterium]